MSNTIILEIWGLVVSALIIIALLMSAVTVILCVFRPQAWNDVMVEPWAKAERREAKKKAKEAERARREFWGR